ncbi:hypothetical protein SAMN05443633_107146 [Chryseobacterium arachidis]|uniref:Uncharacterized protein n=1 Tax=Chryseobacterium arachidis TaxID=1416778 RepID=A0A1M5F2P6_9FLAO|nr:hypothetical protein [Chryseobacterium arachidis]SHF85789.1 hypothetical protein SAMN05443633_107146 [Chryseobacterium arachidis]
MKYNFKFLQTGGVPLTNDLMALVEEAYEIFEVLGDLAGNKTILKGCETVGSFVNPGIVAIDGQLYYFEGGTLYSTVYINVKPIEKTFESQEDKVLIEERVVKFGSGSIDYNWADFVKLETLKEIQIKVNNTATQPDVNALAQRVAMLELKTGPIMNGGIVWVWKKPLSEIPVGWKECTDFRGKTVFGRDPNDTTFQELGNIVGSKTKTISKDNIPDYGLELWAATNSGSTGVGNDLSIIKPNGKGGDGYYDHYYQINSGGKGVAMDILNPGRIVNFIEPNFQ